VGLITLCCAFRGRHSITAINNKGILISETGMD